MRELIKYLIENMVIDFQGEDQPGELSGASSGKTTAGKRGKLLAKLIEEKGVDDMLITLADCLKEHIQGGAQQQRVHPRAARHLLPDSLIVSGAAAAPAATPAPAKTNPRTCRPSR